MHQFISVHTVFSILYQDTHVSACYHWLLNNCMLSGTTMVIRSYICVNITWIPAKREYITWISAKTLHEKTIYLLVPRYFRPCYRTESIFKYLFTIVVPRLRITFENCARVRLRHLLFAWVPLCEKTEDTFGCWRYFRSHQLIVRLPYRQLQNRAVDALLFLSLISKKQC